MLFSVLEKIAENPEASVVVAVLSQVLSAPVYLWILLRRERRSDSQAAFDRAIEFMDRQEDENRKFRDRAEACERAHQKEKRARARERGILQRQITEMSDFIFERLGHRFQEASLPDEPGDEPPTPKPRFKQPPKDKGTDDAIPTMPSPDGGEDG